MQLLELVERAQRGEEQAFAEICERFAGLVKKQAWQPHLRPLGEDAEAEAWLAVARAVKTYRADTGIQVAGYVESQVKYAVWNLFKKERRRWQRESTLEGGDDTGGLSLLATLPDSCDVAASVELRLLSAELKAAVSKLPERQYQAVVATLVQGRRLAEAAQEMGVSPQAVHNLQRRGVARLKACLFSSDRSEIPR
jgi:RNA polymerase sigma factor (sigma-70 family)